MQSPQSPQSPSKNCFCGCLASPCRDDKYCSAQCALEDTEKMLMGEPSHYRNVAQTEILEKLVRTDSRCRVAERIVVATNVACDTEYEQQTELKPLPPLLCPSQSPKQEATLQPRPLLKRLRSSILARRTEQRLV